MNSRKLARLRANQKASRAWRRKRLEEWGEWLRGWVANNMPSGIVVNTEAAWHFDDLPKPATRVRPASFFEGHYFNSRDLTKRGRRKV